MASCESCANVMEQQFLGHAPSTLAQDFGGRRLRWRCDSHNVHAAWQPAVRVVSIADWTETRLVRGSDDD